MAVSHVFSSPVADFTGTVTVFDSLGLTITANATEIVRPSNWNSVHNQFLTLSGNTAGASTMSGSNIVMQGGANITLSANGASLVISGPAPAGMGISAGTQSVSTGTMIFADSNGLAFGMSGSSQITGSYTQSTHSHATAAFSGSNGSFTANTVSFGALNGLSFYTSNGSMVGSHNALTSQSNQAFSADASSTFQTLTFQDSNGVSFSNNAGALRITHALQFTSATSAITSNALHSSASRVINIVAATNNTGGGTASLSSNVSFSAANGITFYTSAGGAVVASHNAITTGRASTDALGLNTAQTNVTWTANSAGVSFNAAGYAGTTTAITGGAAITMNSAGFQFNGASLAGTTSGFTGANISASITHNTAGLAMSMSVAAPGAAAENNWIHLLGANTAGNTTASGTTIGLSGLGVTLSGTNGSVIVVSGGGGGGAVQSGSYPYLGAVNVIGVPGQHSMAFAPINAEASFQFDRICIPVLFSNATNSSNSWSLSLSVGIFSRNVSSLSLIYSTSTGASGTASGTAGNYSIWGGPKILTIGATSTLGGGNLWIGVWSKTSANAGGQTLNLYLASNNNSNFSGIVGAASSTHQQLMPGLGHYSATFSSAMPAAFSMSQIQGTGSLQQRPVALYFASQTV